MTAKTKDARKNPKAPVSKKSKQVETISTFTNEPTNDENLFRVVDREGNWNHYFHKEYGYVPAVSFVLANGWPKGPRFYEWLKNKTAEEADEILRFTGNRGSKVHAALYDIISGENVKINNKYKNEKGIPEMLTANEWDMLLTFTNFAEYFQPHLISQETSIVTPKYAGTYDLRGTILLRAGKKYTIDDKKVTMKSDVRVNVLLDHKTSSGIWPEYRLQTAAYAYSLPASEFPDFTGIVRYGTKHKDGYEVVLWGFDQTAYHYSLFLNAYRIFRFEHPVGWTPNNIEQPTSIKLTIPKNE